MGACCSKNSLSRLAASSGTKQGEEKGRETEKGNNDKKGGSRSGLWAASPLSSGQASAEEVWSAGTGQANVQKKEKRGVADSLRPPLLAPPQAQQSGDVQANAGLRVEALHDLQKILLLFRGLVAKDHGDGLVAASIASLTSLVAASIARAEVPGLRSAGQEALAGHLGHLGRFWSQVGHILAKTTRQPASPASPAPPPATPPASQTMSVADFQDKTSMNFCLENAPATPLASPASHGVLRQHFDCTNHHSDNILGAPQPQK